MTTETTTTYNDNNRDHNIYYGLPQSRSHKKYIKDPIIAKRRSVYNDIVEKKNALKRQNEMPHSIILLTKIFSTAWY